MQNHNNIAKQPTPHTRITAKSPSLGASLAEVWRYRQLLITFAKRDYKVRYAQTLLGFSWSFIQPLASVVVLYFIFQRVMKVPTGNISYLPFALSGLIFWNYFQSVVTQASASLIGNQSIIRKIYFPRLTLPLSRAIVTLVEPLVAALLFIIALLYFNEGSWFAALSFIPLLALTALAALGLGLWSSALSIRFRDLQQAIPFALQMLFFATPIAYSSSLLRKISPANADYLLYLNPLTGIIETFRHLVFGTNLSPHVWISVLLAFCLFASGLIYFQKVERKIADIV